MPKGAGPHPAVVFLHGSGPERRGISWGLANAFARAGVAALIYDKRGSEFSIGGHPRDSYSELAADGLAAVRFLQEHQSIDTNRIGLWGLSEGGWNRTSRGLHGAGRDCLPGGCLRRRCQHRGRRPLLAADPAQDEGIGADGVEQALDLRQSINSYYRTGGGKEDLVAGIRAVEETDWFLASGGYLPVSSEVYMYGSDEWRRHMTWLDFDAVPLLENWTCRVVYPWTTRPVLPGGLERRASGPAGIRWA